MEFEQIIQRISEKFTKAGKQIDPARTEEKLARLVHEFGVPPEEAERSITSDYTREFGLEEKTELVTPKNTETPATPLADIRSGDWVTIEGVVSVLFESRSPSVAQSGILADQSGAVRFTIWAKSQAPLLEPGKWYRFESAAVDEFNNQLNFQVHSGTVIIPLLSEDLPNVPLVSVAELQRGVVSLEGKIVSLTRRSEGPIMVSGVIADGSGAIRFTIRQGDPASGSLVSIEEGTWYRIRYAVADIFRGAMNLQLNAGTQIEPVMEDKILRPAITPVAGVKPGIVCLKVKVIQEYESSSERILQSGILGDETGTIRFVTWKDGGAERLSPGAVYTIYYATADEYNGRLSLTINGAACLPDDIGSITLSSVPTKTARETINLEGEVIFLFPPRSSSVSQSGILAHSTGIIRFTIWASSHAPVLELGKWYRFESAVTDEYNSQISMQVNAGTKITPLSRDAIPKIPVTGISEINKGVISLEGKVVSFTTGMEGPVQGAGVIADRTGAIRFTIRQGEKVSGIEEGRWFHLEHVIADVYRGMMSLQLNAGTQIIPITEDRSLEPAISHVSEIRPGIVCLRVKVVQEYEIFSERMFQSGILGDETGTVRFVTWKDNESKRLTPGMVYTVLYASADEYNGRPSLTLNGATCVADESGTIEVKPSGDEVIGALVHISPGSGLIKRCPVEGCGRVLTRQNYCQIHEIQPKFEYDIRIKGWIDNGKQTWDTIISREGVEKLLGLTLVSAQEMAENNPLGPETVYYHLCEQLLGRYLTCQGRVIENRLFSSICSFLPFDPARHAGLINRAGVNSHE
jgi:replication factor A1